MDESEWVCMYVHACVRERESVCVCIYVCMYVCVYVRDRESQSTYYQFVSTQTMPAHIITQLQVCILSYKQFLVVCVYYNMYMYMYMIMIVVHVYYNKYMYMIMIVVHVYYNKYMYMIMIVVHVYHNKYMYIIS